jgi:cytochrome c biogenesis protein CcdA
MGLLASVLFMLLAAGTIWAVSEIDRTVGPIFAYVAGLVITITPCCLPIFLVITSLAVKQRLYGDALMVAASFGAGIAFFSAVLGAALAISGRLVGLPQVSGIVFALGGAIGYSYAVSELLRFRLPLLGWRVLRMRPASNSYAAAFSTGLMLGAGDIGCPNPLRYAPLFHSGLGQTGHRCHTWIPVWPGRDHAPDFSRSPGTPWHQPRYGYDQKYGQNREGCEPRLPSYRVIPRNIRCIRRAMV